MPSAWARSSTRSATASAGAGSAPSERNALRIAPSIFVAFQRTTCPERRISRGEPSTRRPVGQQHGAAQHERLRDVEVAAGDQRGLDALGAVRGHVDVLDGAPWRLGERGHGVGDQRRRVAHRERTAGEGGLLELGVEDDLLRG